MPNPKLSLIIAMYNIRDYIGECIDSCLKQIGVDVEDYEIIVVNDGSTDDGAEVAAQYLAGHDNATLLHKPNGGLSDARNFGFNHSSGDYVWFIDGDDLICENSVKSIIDAIESDAQLYIPDYYELYTNGETKSISFTEARLPNGVFNAYRLISEDKMPFPPMMAWLQIQKRSFIIKNNLEFLKGARSEDIEYTSKLFSVATKVQHIQKNLYVYRKNREGSIFTELKNNPAWIQNLLNIYSSVLEYLSIQEIEETYKNKVLNVIATFIVYNLYSQDKENYSKSRVLIKNQENSISQVFLQRRSVKSVIKWFFFRCTPFCISKRILGRY